MLQFCPQVDVQQWFESQISKVNLSGSNSALTTQLMWQSNQPSSLDSLCLLLSISLAMGLCSSWLFLSSLIYHFLPCSPRSNHMELVSPIHDAPLPLACFLPVRCQSILLSFVG